MQNLMVIGVYIWGALYTAGIFVAALSFGSHVALYLALVSAGAAYIAQFAGVWAMEPHPVEQAWYVNGAATAVSVLAGVAAGVSLIVGA